MFFFDENALDYEFEPLISSSYFSDLKRKFLKNSAIMRYLVINLEIKNQLQKKPLCYLTNNCNVDQNYIGNILDTNKEDDPSRFLEGYKASDFFLRELSRIRNTKAERKKTILVFDSDRQHIYNKSLKVGTFFEDMRNNLMQNAEKEGFIIIDLKQPFEEHYSLNKKKFEFVNDAHWNEVSHEIVSQEIDKKINIKR